MSDATTPLQHFEKLLNDVHAASLAFAEASTEEFILRSKKQQAEAEFAAAQYMLRQFLGVNP